MNPEQRSRDGPHLHTPHSQAAPSAPDLRSAASPPPPARETKNRLSHGAWIHGFYAALRCLMVLRVWVMWCWWGQLAGRWRVVVRDPVVMRPGMARYR